MGTNYYAVRKRPSVESPIHIGKSSAGWLFLFHANKLWSNYDEVKEWLKQHTVNNKEYVILDEYDEEVPFEEFINMVEEKQNDKWCIDNPDNFTWTMNVAGYRFEDHDFS